MPPRLPFVALEFAGTVEDAARQADLVIEAVPEELESKIEIFTLLDKSAAPAPFWLRISLSSASPKFPASPIAPRIVWACALPRTSRREKRLEIIRGMETDEIYCGRRS